MAIPRPVLIALLGLALCGAAFVATRGAGQSSSKVTPTPAAAVPAPTPPAAPTAPGNAVPGARHKAAPAGNATRHAATAAPHKLAAKPKAAAKPKPAKPALTADQRKALTVLQAVKRGDVIVLFFTQTGAADDSATSAAVASLHGMKHVTVVSAGLNDLTTFRPILQGAGVSQVPAIVIARASHGAQLIQGYVDSNTLRQNVADALR